MPKKKKKTRPMPKLKPDKARRHDFPHVDDIDAVSDMRAAVKTALKHLIKLKIIRPHTNRVEMLRSYLFNMDKHEDTALPFNSHGIGWIRDNKAHCIYAEVSCLIVAFWAFADDPTDANAETVNDFLEYIEELCKDEDTIGTTDMGRGCRWRITNDRIRNGFSTVEV